MVWNVHFYSHTLCRTTIDLNIYDGKDNDAFQFTTFNEHAPQQIPKHHTSTERKPSTMLNTMRKKRSANPFNENYVTDSQNNGKL